MTFKADVTKKKEFANANFKRQIKLLLPILIIVLIIAEFTMVFTSDFDFSNTALIITLVSIFVITIGVTFLCSFLGCKFTAKSFETWELNIEDSYLELKNNLAVVVINYIDIKKYVETDNCIRFFFGRGRSCFIYWKYFESPDELKAKLNYIKQNIGKFKAPLITPKNPTGTKFGKKYYIFIIILFIFMTILKILEEKFN